MTDETERNNDCNESQDSVLRSENHQSSVEIYKLYIERIMKHYDLRLRHFTIYFGFQSGLVLIFGYLIKPFLMDFPSCMNKNLLCAFKVIALIGVIFSFAWRFVARNDRDVQLLMNKILEGIEKTLFTNHDLALYIRTNKDFLHKSNWSFDVIDINCFIPCIFISFWVLIWNGSFVLHLILFSNGQI